jgi:hypothetical protein
MLILQIIGTIVAWKRGWRKLALLPLTIAIVGGFCVGVGFYICGGDPATAGLVASPLDVLCVVALVVMGVLGHARKLSRA